MSGSLRDKAANRARLYQDRIKAKQAVGDYKGAVHEAERWLLEELEKVRRQRPHHAQDVDADVTESLSKLAEAIPFYKPTAKRGASDGVAS